MLEEKLEKIQNVIDMLESKKHLSSKEKLILEKLDEQKDNLESMIEERKNSNILTDIWDGILASVWDTIIEYAIDWLKEGWEIILQLAKWTYETGSDILEAIGDVFGDILDWIDF